MFNCLRNLCEEKRSVSLYTNPDDSSKFVFGKILAVDQKNIVIYMISPDGYFDGILAKPVRDVFRVEADGQYAEKMKKLCAICTHSPEKYVLDNSINLFESVLRMSEEKNLIISIELLNSGYDDIVGFVDVVDDVCKIKQVDEYGFEDGFSYAKVSDITQISCNSQDENRIFRLWQINYIKS